MSELLNIENTAALTAYLQDRGRIGRRESVEIRCLAGGVSNRTVLVCRGGGEAWVIKQALPKLRVQVDWFSDPDRNHHEATGMRWLGQLAPPGTVPQLVFEDREQHLLAMEAVPDPHENWKTILLGGNVDPVRIGQFAELLGTIHRCAAERADELADVFSDRQYFESLRLEPYYGYAAQQVTDAADFLDRLIADTRRIRRTLVHGDYSPKNILLCGPRMVLVDHEVIHWGDPAFDLGFSLTHLLSKAHFLPDRREQFAAAARQYWSDYLAQWPAAARPDELETMAVRHTLGCLLARVAGRSPLEYLDDAHRTRQRNAVVALMRRTPKTVDELTVEFIEKLA
jgi:5-methylthioribose kinase